MPLLKVVSGQKPREIAVRVLNRPQNGEFIENLLDRALASAHLSPEDRGLCQELVYGLVRWQATLDWLISRKTGGRKQKPVLQILLRLGLYQIFWLDRIPDHAAVNETVELARQFGLPREAGFVNALLRGYLRESEATEAALKALKNSDLPTGYSHPEWLVTRWRQRFGDDQAVELMAWNNEPAETFARVNTLKTDAGKLIEVWREEGVEYDFVPRDWLTENLVFKLKKHPPLASLPSFKQGFFYIQDPSTLLAPDKLQCHAGQRILDLCAAPGGKVTYLAQQLQNQASIVAHDLSDERLQWVLENCRRLGVTCVDLATANSPLLHSTQSYDRVLIDAPCSNSGVIRRRLDLRWRIRPEEIQRLQAGQLELLRRGAAFLKPGARLVYSTCSLEREENEDVVDKFITENPTYKLLESRTLLPFKDKVDGAFVATIEKSAT
jgi:16S rRNA (cytosine967-C5)-methyltransferase